MNELLNHNPLFILFLVIALGHAIGMVTIRGNKLGVAAVLFCGLIMGNIYREAHIPDALVWVGLIIFIYAIGLNSGSSFFITIKRNGKKIISFILFNLILIAVLTIIAAILFDIDRATIAGIFAGTTTNTSSLAALLDMISQSPNYNSKEVLDRAVTGFSISYPIGIFGVIIAMVLSERFLKVNYKSEESALTEEYELESKMNRLQILVVNPAVEGSTIREFKRTHNLKVVFGRYVRNEAVELSHYDTIFQTGDIFLAVGSENEMKRCVSLLGKVVDTRLPEGESAFVNRRVFVSNPQIVGQSLASINLGEKYSIIVSRIRRGDIDLLATNDTILELGDRIRFVAKKVDLPGLIKLFGDSYDQVSRFNLATFGVGIFLGLWIGSIEIPLPGEVNLKLGFAGGPLLVALVLGALRKTGAILWTIPYSTNMTLRQLGLIIMLAGIGINSGAAFFETIVSPEGIKIFGIGTAVVIIAAFLSFVLGYKLFKIPYSLLMGLLANQPAILDFAEDKTKNKLPNIGYSLMLPLAIIIKIFVTQLIFIFYS